MKRSKQIRLVLMGASTFALAACDQQLAPAVIYKTLDQCVSDQVLTAQQCSSAYSQSLAESRRVAPRYNLMSDCQEDHPEGCEPLDVGIGPYIPNMTGFMATRPQDQDEESSGGDGSSTGSQPLYTSRDDPDTWRTGTNESVGSGTGKRIVSRDATQAITNPMTVSRDGFGSRAAARAGLGG